MAVRTLHLVYRLDTRLGGAVHATLTVCKYLARAGEPVEVAGSVGPGDQLDYLSVDYPEFRTHCFQRSFPSRYANSSEMARWLPKVLDQFDLVELHTVFSVFIWRAAGICRRLKKPYFVRPHGSLDAFDLQKHALLKKLVGPLMIRPLLSHAAATVLTAPLEAERLVTYGAKVDRIVLPLPVTLPSRAGDRAAFRRTHGIPKEARAVLFMSRLDYKKGLQFLIPALGRLKSEFQNLYFILAGSGEQGYEMDVERMLQQVGLGSSVVKLGFVSGQEKLDALAGSDLFALPSLNENFGIVLVEAMYAGLPLLISNQVYICDDIHQAGAGIICEPNTDSVTSSLRSMLKAEANLKAMGLCGRKLVETRYQPQAATDLLVEAYRKTLSRRQGFDH